MKKTRSDTAKGRRGDAAKERRGEGATRRRSESVRHRTIIPCFSSPVLCRRVAPSPRRRIAFIYLLPFAFAQTSFAHGGKPHTPRDLLTTWGLEPVVLVGLALAGWLYWRGVRRLWRESAMGQGIRRWEAWCYAGGWLALFVALVSPLHPMGRVLFSAHMTQHEVLMLIAAPLLVLGRPVIAFLYAMPLNWRRRLGRFSKQPWFASGWRVLTLPLVAWAVHAVALWVWHVPALFDATINNEWVHTAQHLSFLLSALLFWWAVIHSRRGLMSYGAALLYVFTTSIHSGALGALITFAGSLWYPAYEQTTASWGLTPLEDQQLGGLIMWIPAGLVYIFAGLMLFAGWLRESDARAARNQRARLYAATGDKG